MTDEEKRAEDRFRKIVKLAWRCEPLGKEFTYMCDHELYERLANLFTGHRREKTVLKPELEEKGNIFKAAYKHTLMIQWQNERTFELSADALEIMPYGVAGDLLKSDKSAEYGSIYTKRYEDMKMQLDPRYNLGSITVEGGVYI